ncbi:MAG: DUF1819 family protein [Saprospiraceae bacterium]
MLTRQHAYSSAFTATALLFNEFSKARESILEDNFVRQMKDEVMENTRLGIKTQSARKRISQEMIKRYESSPPGFWPFFFGRSEEEQKLALFFLCLITYGLMLDFHLEVALKRWKARSERLEVFDLQMRLDEISSSIRKWTPGLKQQKENHHRLPPDAYGSRIAEKRKSPKADPDQPSFWNISSGTMHPGFRNPALRK